MFVLFESAFICCLNARLVLLFERAFLIVGRALIFVVERAFIVFVECVFLFVC